MSEKSDEVRILELAIRKLTEQLNQVLEECTADPSHGEPNNIKRISKGTYMKARACLPAGYSMALTNQKKEKKNA